MCNTDKRTGGRVVRPAKDQAAIGIFELVEAMTYPGLEDALQSDVGLFVEPTPFARALLVRLFQNSGDDVDEDGKPVLSYNVVADFNAEVTVWQPATRPGDGAGRPIVGDGSKNLVPGYAYGPPAFGVGDRVFCRWNDQSNRWEIEAPAPNICRVELQETFMPVQGEVQATISDAADDSAPQTITVYRSDDYCGGFGVGRAGQEELGETPGPLQCGGTHAYAIWSPSRGCWEFLSDQFKLVAEATAYDDLPTGATGRVNLWWLDYAGSDRPLTFDLVNSGQQVLALNSLFPDIKCGEKCIVSYDRQEDRWTVLAADFTTRYQDLDVVTGVTLSIDFDTRIYTLHYTTRQIQLPPWVTIGDEVLH